MDRAKGKFDDTVGLSGRLGNWGEVKVKRGNGSGRWSSGEVGWGGGGKWHERS